MLTDLLLSMLGEPPMARSGPDVQIHPRAADCTHDVPISERDLFPKTPTQTKAKP